MGIILIIEEIRVGTVFLTCKWNNPVYTCDLISLTLLQLYATVLGYKMMKSASQEASDAINNGPLLAGQDLGGGGGFTGGAAAPASNVPQGPTSQAAAGVNRPQQFNAFAGQGQRLGQM